MITARCTVASASRVGDSEIVYLNSLETDQPDAADHPDAAAVDNLQCSLSIEDPELFGTMPTGSVVDVLITVVTVDTATPPASIDQAPPATAVTDYGSDPADQPSVTDVPTNTAVSDATAAAVGTTVHL